MLTNKFVKKLQSLDFVHGVTRGYNAIGALDQNAYTLATVYIHNPYSLNTAYGAFDRLLPDQRRQLMNLLMEYAMTPVEKREITLSELEKNILENLKEFKWIARDEFGELILSKGKPLKYNFNGKWLSGGTTSLQAFNHLFGFIEWSDEEPYKTQDLLGVK